MLHSYMRRARHFIRRLVLDHRVITAARIAGYILVGFLLSAASIAHRMLPIAMGFLWACSGPVAVLAALGGAVGYILFWGSAGYQGVAWMAVSLPCVLFLSTNRVTKEAPLLKTATAGLVVAATGVVYQVLLGDMTPIPIYLLRVAFAFGASFLFEKSIQGRNPILEWLSAGLGILALAQIAPFSWLNLGFVAAAMAVTAGAFPVAALAGLALDVAQVTPVCMAAVLVFAYLTRFLPRWPRWLGALMPAVSYILLSVLWGNWSFEPLLALILGGVLGTVLPLPGKRAHRRGETGVAQVRLEMAAGVLAQTGQLLQEVPERPVDEDILVQRAAERACGSCAFRKSCQDQGRISQTSPVVLHKNLHSVQELPISCRKSGRFLAELHRAQEQLRSIISDRRRQSEYRAAVSQQYSFLSGYLQSLSDTLAKRAEQAVRRFEPQVTVCGNRAQQENGDRLLRFSGVGSKYYVLLCDGMGTGPLAVREGRRAAGILQRMLCAGYPAEHALRSLNSLCALQDQAGLFTVDLAELQLDTGKVTLYKWGASPSYLVTDLGVDRVGTVSPPPGLSVSEDKERADRFTLRRGEWLVMVSDGVGDGPTLSACADKKDLTPQELAEHILDRGQLISQDDATVAVIRLVSAY